MSLPGRCIVCRRPVQWGGKSWRNPGQRRGRHVCPAERETCGLWMRQAKERCARRPGHRDGCRTRYALDNDYRRNRGHDRVVA